MAQLPRETDEMENQKTQEVLILDNCVIINIRDYDTLKERLRKYETQFKELTSKQREREVDNILDFLKLSSLDENTCELALKNGIVLDDFVKEDRKGEWQTLADKYLTSVDELKEQAYQLAIAHIELNLKIKEYQREKGEEQPQ